MLSSPIILSANSKRRPSQTRSKHHRLPSEVPKAATKTNTRRNEIDHISSCGVHTVLYCTNMLRVSNCQTVPMYVYVPCGKPYAKARFNRLCGVLSSVTRVKEAVLMTS